MMGRLRYQSHEDNEIGCELRDKIEGKKMDTSDEMANTHTRTVVITSFVQRQGRSTSQAHK
jgi:hypothetical protein